MDLNNNFCDFVHCKYNLNYGCMARDLMMTCPYKQMLQENTLNNLLNFLPAKERRCPYCGGKL